MTISAALDEPAGIATEHVDVLIVGAGPAGLSAAAALRDLGLERVVVVERQTEAGGIPRHCGHSPFGMREFHRVLSGRRYASRLVSAALQAGAELRLRHAVVSISEGPQALVATPEGTRRIVARQILLATGIRETSRAGLLASGARPPGIMNTGALQDMVFLRKLRPFRRPVIVGTELVSMSAILTCMMAGARPAAVIETGPRGIARIPFLWLPRLLGIPQFFNAEITDITAALAVESITVKVAGRPRVIACDGVLFTGRFTPEASVARMSGLTIDGGTQGPSIDSRGRASMAGVYAAGNVLRGVETAGQCWSEGRSVAAAMMADLKDAVARQAVTTVETGPGIKFAMPQAITEPSDGAFSSVQVRLSNWLDGELVVERDGQVIWKRRIVSGPERRIAIPLAELGNQKSGTLRVIARNARG